MKLEIIEQPFTVCKVADYSQVALTQDYCFIGKTDAENSLVCPTAAVPQNTVVREDGWRAFRIAGTLDFSLIGILADISGLLAENGIGLFAVSTYDTDYIFTKQAQFDRAISLLTEKGYTL